MSKKSGIKTMREVNIEDLIGKIIINISGLYEGSDYVIIDCEDKYIYSFWPETEANISLIDGNPNNLIGRKIVRAEKFTENTVSSEGNPATSTIFKLETRDNTVTIRWDCIPEYCNYASIQINKILK